MRAVGVMSRRNADFREALGYCAETCPEIDATFDGLLDDLLPMVAQVNQDEARQLIAAACARVKDKGTLLLRDALVSACSDKQEVESDRNELADEVRKLADQVADLESQVRELSAELDEVTA